jgi:WD40-like Beta Propeller Repeat
VPESFSPDGAVLAFSRHQGGQFSIWLLTLGEKPVARRLTSATASEYSPKFSPNGRWLAYVVDQQERSEVYVRGYPSGEPIPVSSSGGAGPVWSRDGRTLFYETAQSGLRTLMSVPVLVDGGTLKLGTPSRVVSLALAGGEEYGRSAYWGPEYDVFPDGDFVRGPGPGGARSPSCSTGSRSSSGCRRRVEQSDRSQFGSSVRQRGARRSTTAHRTNLRLGGSRQRRARAQLAAAWSDHRQDVAGSIEEATREAARLLRAHPTECTLLTFRGTDARDFLFFCGGPEPRLRRPSARPASSRGNPPRPNPRGRPAKASDPPQATPPCRPTSRPCLLARGTPRSSRSGSGGKSLPRELPSGPEWKVLAKASCLHF